MKCGSRCIGHLIYAALLFSMKTPQLPKNVINYRDFHVYCHSCSNKKLGRVSATILIFVRSFLSRKLVAGLGYLRYH